MNDLTKVELKQWEPKKNILIEKTCEINIKTENIERHTNQTNELVLHKNDSQDPLSTPVKLSNDNPWAVTSFKEFLWYNCPECEFKYKDEEKLYEHAIKNHYKAQKYYNIKNDNMKSEIIEANIETFNIENENTCDENIRNYQKINEMKLKCFKTLDIKQLRLLNVKQLRLLPNNPNIDLGENRNTFKVKNNIFDDISDEFGALVENNTVECCNIGFEFPSLRSLHAIQNQFHEKENLTRNSVCPICNEIISKWKYVRHNRQIGKNIESHENLEEKKQIFEKHILQKHSFRPFIILGSALMCKLCCEEVSDGFNCKCYPKNRFIWSKSNFVDLKCKRCSYVSSSLRENSLHKIKCNTKYSRKCPDCNSFLPTNDQFRNHCYKIHGKSIIGSIICDICGKFCSSDWKYRSHYKVVHKKFRKPPKMCDLCGKYFKWNNLRQHKRYKHQDLKLRTCEKCGKIYENRAELYGHYINDHPKYTNPVKIDNEYVCQCKICFKILSSPTAFYTHLKLSHKMKVAMRNWKIVKLEGEQIIPIDEYMESIT